MTPSLLLHLADELTALAQRIIDAGLPAQTVEPLRLTAATLRQIARASDR